MVVKNPLHDPVQVATYVERATAEQVAQLASADGVSRSVFVRRLINAELARRTPVYRERQD